MADSFVTFLLENLPRLLAQQLNMPDAVAEQIKSLHNELGILNSILKTSEGKQNGHEIIKEVIGQIRDAVYEAEDVIDTCIYNFNLKRLRKWWDVVSYLNHSKILHDVAFKIDNIKQRINEIKQTQQEYDVEFGLVNHVEAEVEELAAAVESLHERRQKVEEDDVVGFEDYSEQVINKLTGGGQQRDIISIIGMGGLGKTTLARKICRNNRVTHYFDCCAWTNVSNDFEVQSILLTLLGQVSPESVNESHQLQSTMDLMAKLCKSLESKRYLVVLDDIWEPEAWDAIKDAFPFNQNGSRILITSRSNVVANHVSVSDLNQYQLPFLNEESAWELFGKRVFQGEGCPPELENLGKQMARSCDGLPLSIVVLAGLLLNLGRCSAKWSMVAGNEIWHLFKEKAKCSDILALSYHYLPRKLKPCFLYVGLYPEDFEISSGQLIRQWVAEGLIQEDTGKKQPEDIAEFYLQQLIDRSLIQVGSRRSDGGVKTCRIHDLLRELCIEESKKDKFFEVYSGNSNSTPAKPRRLSLYSSVSSYLSSSSTHTDNSFVRSLICFGEVFNKSNLLRSKNENRRYWKSLLEAFNLLRVLDIGSDLVMYKIPDGIEKLSHLRYLRANTKFISDDISNLWNLETLDMRGLAGQHLPSHAPIWKLKRLRHLFMSGPVKMPPLDEPLDNLQSLSTVALDGRIADLFSKDKLPKLRKLGLMENPSSNDGQDSNNFWRSLQQLSHLQTLKLDVIYNFPREADWFPSKITKITLQSNLHYTYAPGLQVLGAIPNLEILKLRTNSRFLGSLQEFDIHCETESFKSLRVFQIKGLPIKNWSLALGAMPRLQRLVIRECYRFKLPNELWSLEHLKDVQMMGSSAEMTDMLRKQKMKDGCKLTILS